MSLEEALEELDSWKMKSEAWQKMRYPKRLKASNRKLEKRIQAIQSLIRLHRPIDQAEAHIKRLIKTFSDID